MHMRPLNFSQEQIAAKSHPPPHGWDATEPQFVAETETRFLRWSRCFSRKRGSNSAGWPEPNLPLPARPLQNPTTCRNNQKGRRDDRAFDVRSPYLCRFCSPSHLLLVHRKPGFHQLHLFSRFLDAVGIRSGDHHLARHGCQRMFRRASLAVLPATAATIPAIRKPSSATTATTTTTSTPAAATSTEGSITVDYLDAAPGGFPGIFYPCAGLAYEQAYPLPACRELRAQALGHLPLRSTSR